MPTGFEKQTAQRATDCGETPAYDSKVVAPRNPKLIRGPKDEVKMTPSSFMKEVSQTTDEKLANTHTMYIPKIIELMDMGENTHQKFSMVDIDEPLFQPFPSEITFQQFEPHVIYEVPLLLRNNDKVSRLVKVYQADSPYFNIISPADVTTKVAPGMATIFRIQFTPSEKRDYIHELICMTEREKFVVPVRAIGARAMLDFPDEVNFSLCPVKHPTTKTLLVRNIGNKEAHFALYSSGQFSVSPENGILAVNESIQVDLTFQPMTIGDHNDDLVVNYDTGEDITVNLYGGAYDANVRLDKNSLRVENTYISMANQRTVTISNRSDVIVHYKWKQFATPEEEQQQKEGFFGHIESEEQNEHDAFLQECIMDPTLRDRMAILTRTFQNRRTVVDGDELFFSDEAFTIMPSEGDIWPNSTGEINIIFKPMHAKSYNHVAYCDITGRETRLPLRLKGDGIGPQVFFSYDTMNMGHIFINSKHSYEVVLGNRGDIDAPFRLLPSDSTFGPYFSFAPSSGVIEPGGFQAIEVQFSSPILGDFSEDFFWEVDGLPYQHKLNFKGCVIGPTFHFDVPRLKFGTVSYGFKSTQEATLVNTALVGMSFSLRVPGDGDGEVVSATSGEVTLGRSNLSTPAREFQIVPASGTVDPQSEVKIKVELTSNSLKKYDLALVVDIEGVGQELLSLPISAKCVAPSISVVTPILDYTRCFLNHPYELCARLCNDSDLPAKYDLVPQVSDEDTPLLFNSPQPTGILPPHTTLRVPLAITPQDLEELETYAEFSIFGSMEPPLQVTLKCIGEGPVVHVTPVDIDWGQTQVLTDVSRVVTLSNESLIPAPFSCRMVRPNTLWKIEPSEGVIPPEDTFDVRLTVHLDDCIRFQDKLAIEFKDSQTRTVKVQAYGHGTTIVSDPPMTPAIELGHHFSSKPIHRTFTLTNRGRRHQQLFWTTEGYAPVKIKSREQDYNPLDVKYRNMPPPAPPPQPVFKLTPSRFELEAGESIELHIEGESSEPKVVKERLMCHAIIGRSSGKERIMKTDISITFISPLLEFSSKQVAFRVDKHPDDVLTKQYNELTMTNVSSLPLHTTVSLEEPFNLIEDGIEPLTCLDVPLEVGESKSMTIQFDPAYQNDSHSRIAEKLLTITYKEHPHTDYVSLRGEVHFPNLTFEKMEVNFGCILNDTEVTRYVNITNRSPMAVNYRWSFLEPEAPIVLYPLPVPPPPEVLEAETHVAFEEPDSDPEHQQQDGDEHPGQDEEGGGGAESGEEKMDEMKDDDAVPPALPDNIMDGLQIQITSPKPALPEESEKAATLKSSSRVEEKDGMSERERKKDKKGAAQEKKKSPRKSTAKSGGSKTHSKASMKSDPKADDEVATVDQPLSDRDPPVQDEPGQEERAPTPLMVLRPGTAERQRLNKLQYIQSITEPTVVGIEEVFDILPLYGTLLPGESDTVTFTFYGHAEIGCDARALCHVEGGPCYELELKGEASIVQYEFDVKNINYGRQMYDQVCMTEITLQNTGKVNFDFRALNMDPSTAERPLPGVPVMIPHTGHVEAYSEQKLLVKFLPGYPEKFHKSFEIQVAHFEPDSINLCGEGVFPRVSFDLPRYADDEGLYTSLLKEAKEILGRDIKKKALPALPSATPVPSPTPRDPCQEDAKSIMSLQNEFPSELEFQLEVERLLVKEFSIELQTQSGSKLDTDRSQQTMATPAALMASVVTSRSKRNVRTKARLPDYLLDFGYVVLGTVRTHIIRATNTGYFPCSFFADRAPLMGTGFNVELDHVRHLPGFPDHETVDFRVSFDPLGSNLGLGEMEALVPVNIVNGPCVFLRLQACVTMPDMEISTDRLEFGDVQCGQCKVVTVQLHNHKEVKCEWSSLPTEKEKKMIDKHMPLHLRRKLKPARNISRNFEMVPPTGMLLPGQRVNIQVKFMPTEEKLYSDRIALRISQSSQRLTLMTTGMGLEPRLELGNSLLEFGPILPHSTGDEKDVIIKNPCSFPIEFYSLEFDKQYLTEEKTLRLMKDYDEHGTLLLPPRNPGEALPSEITEFYDEQKKRLEEEEEKEKARIEAELAAQAAAAAALEGQAAEGGEEGQVAPPGSTLSASGGAPASQPSPAFAQSMGGEESGHSGQQDEGSKPAEGTGTEADKGEDDDTQDKKDSGSTVGVGDLIEITPVSAAIARHLGIDLSPEGKAAMRRRGISVVVHGAPLSGKTTTSIALAKHYEAALLTVDSVVLDAISNGNTQAGLTAREMCAKTARAQLARDGDGSEGQAQGTGGALSMEAVYAHTQGLGAASGMMGGGGAHSVISNRKTSTISGHKPAHSTVAGEDGAGTTVGGGAPTDKKSDKKDKKGAKQEGDTTTQLSSSPPPAAPIARRLSVSASVAGEEGLMSCILPDDLLVEILAERMQLNDCHKGVVFDGLETLFSPNQASTAKALLKAFNNRKYIYFITLKLEQQVLQAREKRQQEEREQEELEREEEEKQRLEEMSEDEYDALTEEEKAEIDHKRLKVKKERLQKKEMEERLERERKERELLALMEEKKLEDDKAKKKKGAKQGDKDSMKGGGGPGGPGQAKKGQDGRAAASVSQAAIKKGPLDPAAPSDHALKGAQSAAMERPESHGTAGSDQPQDEGTKKKKKDKGRPISNEVAVEVEVERDPVREAEIMLTNRFKAFEHGMKDIEKILARWDRTIGQLVQDLGGDEPEVEETPAHPPSGRKGKTKAEKEKEKERERERLERERLEREKAEKAAAESGEQGESKEGEGEGKEGEEKEQLGVPNIILDASEPDDTIGQKILDTDNLPTCMEVLDGLGLGPSGPPIPPPASFSVVPYPVKRKPPLGFDPLGHYYFVASSPDDPNIGQEEKPKEPEGDLEATTPDKGAKEEFTTPTGKKGGKDKLRPGAESTGSRRRSAKGSRNRKGSITVASPPPGTTTPGSDIDGQSSTTGDINLQDSKNIRLTIFRWTVPAEGEVTLKLRFQSDELGQFDQTLNFEIVGTRRRYQLFCRGVCAFPNISREPRVVFPHRKKSKKADEIVKKKYILSTELLQFGPLLAGKSRDRYRDGKYPENMEKLTISNTSPLEAEITFCFQHDGNGSTFLLDPPTMNLKSHETRELTIWVYPKNQGYFEDTIVCCIKENPEPVQFRLACYGVRPEVELDKKQLHFEKVLLHRKDTKVIYLRNSTLLPVAWRVSGLESLGDDFSVSTDAGIIEPKSEFALNAHFRAMKPINTKKMIRLEVSDVDNIMGLLQTENIQVLAEAYDVALDMSFPKGADGGLDFGVIKVMDESKLTCSLKNKGKYEIAYSFILESTPTSGEEIINLFSVIPAKGVLIPNDRPTQVQVIFKSRKEITIKDQPILKCQVIEPNLKDGGETIASIPVKLSARSIFSKYNIFPVNDINFGAVLVNQRKPRTFQIENKGEFDFKYTINRMVRDMPVQPPAMRGRAPPGTKRTKSRDGSSSGRSVAKPKRAESIRLATRQDIGGTGGATGAGAGAGGGGGGGGGSQTRLQLGMFTVYPAYGLVSPGSQVSVNVDCLPEAVGSGHEDLAVEISDRDPADHPQGIPYKLMAEACIPGINLTDLGSIFEEHRVVKNLSVFLNTHQLELDGGGVFGEDENKFIFGHVLVGRKAKARFKISNAYKVPCDVVFSCKLHSSKPTSKLQDIFDVEPARASIQAHGSVYATVTFSPPSMQTYAGQFEVGVDGLSGPQAKLRNLSFEVQGEGNLPRVSVLKPSLRNKKGTPLLLFTRLLAGRSQTLPLCLSNDGTLPSKVDIDLEDSSGCFKLQSSAKTKLIYPTYSDTLLSETDATKRHPHAASLIIQPRENAEFHIVYTAAVTGRSAARVGITVTDNQFENQTVQIVGEGYEDDVTLDNIHSLVTESTVDGAVEDEQISAAPSNHIHFGDCHINDARQLSFTMTNHSQTDTIRFQWPENHPQLKFSPALGHLHAGCAKDVVITFKTATAVSLASVSLNCKISKINFDKPVDQVMDWDDRMRTVNWVDFPAASNRPTTGGEAGAGRPRSTQDNKREERESRKEGHKKGGGSSNAAAAQAAAEREAERERNEEEMRRKLEASGQDPPRPSKKKVVETEPEPTHTVKEDSSREMELKVSANADFCKFKCKVDAVHFKETLMFQTRMFSFQVTNKGTVELPYSWQVVMEDETAQQKSVSFADGEQLRLPSRCSTGMGSDLGAPDVYPFSIEPEVGSVAPGKKQSFQVKFAPLDIKDYEGRLICRVPNLEEGKQGPVLAVKGRSVMPYCHFDLEDSDYITGARRNPELPGPGGAPPGSTLDPNTRVIEFISIGVQVKNTRQFYIINPTATPYTFLWTCEDEEDPKKPLNFTCTTRQGQVASGKKTQVSFEFLPTQLGVVESFWRFTIPEQNIAVPFLLVGDSHEPAVSTDRSHINFKSMLLGNAAYETIFLINNETRPFDFEINETSCHSEAFSSRLQVSPMKGTILPNDRIPIDVSFVPHEEKVVNFNVQIYVRKKTLPICLNVKAEGYSMNAMLLCEDSTGQKKELTSSGINSLDFGEIEVNEKAVRSLYIVNTGKFNFDFEWELKEETRGNNPKQLSITPESGAVPCNDRKRSVLAFRPTTKTTLRGCELICRIANGPTYEIKIVGHGVAPGLHFSFNRFDFGPCFIHRAGMPPHTKELTLTNKDSKDISVDCLYTSTSYLNLQFDATVLAPGESCTLTFTFYPREAMRYHEIIPFELNGLSRTQVEVLGLGTQMRVEVANPSDRVVNFAALRMGQTAKRIVPIINNSPAPLSFTVAMTPLNSILQQVPTVLKLSPSQEITLEAKGGTSNLELVFSPKCRIPQFTEEIMLECAGLSQPLLVVSGSCQGIEISLDQESIPFGAVVLKSSTTRKLLMYNTGDIGAAFKWNASKFGPDFAITPPEGYISPGMTVTFEITFKPVTTCQDLRYDKLECSIEGSKRPLPLVLTGMCVNCQPQKEILHFSTHVRVKDTRSLTLHNRTNQRWAGLKPVIEGEHWTGAESITVEPQQSKAYELVYRPLIMTTEGKKHTGSVFFALPDGSGLMYNMLGVAEAPKPAGNITRDIPSKTHYTESLPVSNWLKRPQRFKVVIEMIKPDKLDPATTLKGLDYIDVPGLSKRDYKLNFFCHKEASYAAKIIFRNEQTNEFQFYYVTFKSTPPGIIDLVEMSTPVRLSTSHTISLENPLALPVTFQTSCPINDIMVPPQLIIPPQSEGTLSFEFLPLKTGETSGKLTLSSNELGQYAYDLQLTATPAGPEKAVFFRSPLGGSHTQTTKFINFAKLKTEYTCKIDNSDFHSDKSITAAPGSSGGSEVSFDITFESSRLGETRGTLTLTSPLGGEYTFPVFGTCIPPKPQGPYTIKAGSTTSIPFRNIFSHTTAFTFHVDNPAFTCKAADQVRGKKSHNIIIGFEGNPDGTKAPKMGKLVISCARSAGGAANVSWTYYLKGITP